MSRVVIDITEHAFQRLKERSGLNRSAADRIAHKAYENGLKHSECIGNLEKWITGNTKNSKKNSIFRVHGDKLWIFVRNKEKDSVTLITVMQIPANLKELIKVSMQKRVKE